MVLDLKLRKIGNSVGFVLPKEALSHLQVAEGDTLTLTKIPGGLRLTPSGRKFANSKAGFESLNHRYRNALKDLAN
ncbi:MAG: AbrB/MazE/SpoVT family DNA-binding domain-containing protein [Opitutaceae bacterium]